MINKIETKEKSEFNTEDQKINQRNSFVSNNNRHDVPDNDYKQNHITNYNNIVETDEQEIQGSVSITDLSEYKERMSTFGEKEENLDELSMLLPKYKSRLSKGANNIKLGKALSIDSTRMKGVKIALENYYKLLEDSDDIDDDNDEDDQEIKNRKAQRRVELTTSLQNIVSTCNKYIANRWPISKEGRSRLSEVKEIRENAIKELGKEAGHPGWRLFGEYLKFGFKAVTAPIWVPVKYTGRYVKRVGKRFGRLVYKKARRVGDDLSTFFGSWKAAMTTIGVGAASVIGGTVMNAVNCVFGALGITWNLIGGFYTVPRYLYHLVKGDVKFDATEMSKSGKYKLFFGGLTRPHFYSTWFKYMVFRIKTLNDFYYGHKGNAKKGSEDDLSHGTKLIYNEIDVNKRFGENFEYMDLGPFSFFGPVMDPYYHSTTLKFKKLINFFRYSDKNDFDMIDKRSKIESQYVGSDWDESDGDEMEDAG